MLSDYTLDELFIYADITLCEKSVDSERVYLECVIRRNGYRVFVVGDDLSDAIDVAMRQVEDQQWTIDSILSEYDMDLDELRYLVGQPELQQPELVEETPVVSSVEVLAAAQPLLAKDNNGRLYLVFDILTPVLPDDDDFDWDGVVDERDDYDYLD